MAMVVRSNLMAYNANRQLGMNNSAVSKNLEKLSSGFKINRAADDAAGLAVSEKMKAQIKGLEQASLNSQDGISLVQTAEGALTEVHDMLNRMTELATKSANGTIQDDVDREAIQNEVNKLNDEIDRVAESTNFNGIKLLNGTMSGGGSSGSGKGYVDVSSKLNGASTAATPATGDKAKHELTFATATASTEYNVELRIAIGDDIKTINVNAKLGAGATDLSVGIKDALQEALGKDYVVTSATGGTAGKLTIEAKNSGEGSIQILSADAKTAAGAAGPTATLGAASTITKGTNDNLTIDLSGATAGNKNYLNIDGKKFQILKQGEKADSGAIALYTDTGEVDDADTTNSIIEQLKKHGISVKSTTTPGELQFDQSTTTTSGGGGGLTLQIGDTGDSFNQVTVSVDNMSSTGIGTSGLNVSSQIAAKGSIETIKSAINKVSTNRSELGALQNRLEHTINNLDVAAENMSSANSRIRDTDMAKQMMEYTKMNVLTQSAQAMLAQANQNPQSILQLLQ